MNAAEMPFKKKAMKQYTDVQNAEGCYMSDGHSEALVEQDRIERYLEINALIKELKEEKENLKTNFMIEMKTNDTTQLVTDAFVVEIKTVERKILNKEKMIAAGIPLEQYQEASVSERISIKKR